MLGMTMDVASTARTIGQNAAKYFRDSLVLACQFPVQWRRTLSVLAHRVLARNTHRGYRVLVVLPIISFPRVEIYVNRQLVWHHAIYVGKRVLVGVPVPLRLHLHRVLHAFHPQRPTVEDSQVLGLPTARLLDRVLLVLRSLAVAMAVAPMLLLCPALLLLSSVLLAPAFLALGAATRAPHQREGGRECHDAQQAYR